MYNKNVLFFEKKKSIIFLLLLNEINTIHVVLIHKNFYFKI